MNRRWALLGVLALVATGCATAEAEPEPTPISTVQASPSTEPVAADLARFYDQQPDWQPCRDGLECATVTAPLDYADPTGETIELALLKVPATDPARRVGSLFVNPGGPGASGLEYAAAADVIVSPAVRAVYDVVGFDPRGVGQSTPVECISDADLDRSFVEGDPTPDTPDEVDALLASTEEFRAGCQTKSGNLLPHVGTMDVARDLDVLRAVVGDDTLTYLGKSYGTSIGAEYARQFPAAAGRLVLDGAVDPLLSDKDVLLGQAGGFELALSRFVDDCLAQGCSLGSTQQQVLDVVSSIIETADDSPLPTSSRPLSQTLAVYGIIGPLYWPASQGYPLLEQALEQALAGDGTALLAAADAYLQRSPDGTFPTNQWDVFTPVSCLDRPGNSTPADVEALLPEFTSVSPRFGESLAWGLTACTDWPIPSDGLPAPVPAPEAPPVLVVGTTGDPATPYEWAVSLAEQMESGVLLTYEGTPHTAYRKGNECVDSAVDEFFVDGTVPEEGLRCS
ncbi:MAG: alpha/beta hydrolase [Jiangellales bacterium]